MSEPPPAKKIKKTEDDVMELLTRYSTTTILSVLHEIHEYTTNHPNSVEIDWAQLCKNTCTGISNAREYQMLWRNLAYQEPLVDIEDGAKVMDDCSDLEIEIEADPHPTAEEEFNAKECVKALLSSCTPRLCSVDEDMHSGSPLLDSPDKQASPNCGGNAPNSNSSKKTPTGICDKGMDGNGLPTGKKKKQPWTKEEDEELKAAVKKCGEGNWENILKSDFKHNRTPSQLHQRWNHLRKKDCSTNNGKGAKCSNLATNEERLAAQKAICIAIDMPMTGSISAYLGMAHTGISSTSTAATSQASRACAAQSLSQLQDKTTPNIFTKPRPLLKKASFPTMKHTVGPNPLIQAAAFAAGGRIANPSTAASLLKAAQSKNAVRIGPGIQICTSIPNNNTKPSVNQPIRPSSTPVPSGSSFGMTLSSLRSSVNSLDSKDKAADDVEEKKIAASENGNDCNADDLLKEERVAKKSNIGEVEIMIEKKITSHTDATNIEVKKSQDHGTEKSEETAAVDKLKESSPEPSVAKDSQAIVDEKK